MQYKLTYYFKYLIAGDGPIEPRAFPFYNQFYLSFNNGLFVRNKVVDTTLMWDMENDKFVMPIIADGQPLLNRTVPFSMPRDKHWSPYTWQGEVYMLYSYDPLRIIKCDPSFHCKFTQNMAPKDYQFDEVFNSIRGGTPTLTYRDNFYITIAHSTLFRQLQPRRKRYYTMNLVVMRLEGESNHQVIYMSEPIELNAELMNSVHIVRDMFISHPFLFPVSLLMEDEDSIVIGGHISDQSSYLFRLTGIRKLMDRVISRSRYLDKQGPPRDFMHNMSRTLAHQQTGFNFMS